MQIEIWSDIACPWCYIGRRRFETALAQFEHRDQVEIIWRSFQLDPNAPREFNGSIYEMLAKKYNMSREKSEAMHAHVTELAAQEGLEYNFDIAHPVNSFDAHRLLHFALHHGVQSEMKERIQRGYFTEGVVVSDHDTLVRLAVDVGLDAEETRAMLASDQYAAEVRADIQRARMFGIQGVPFFAVDEKYGVSGAQPAEVFKQTLERAWADAHPLIQVVGADGNVCDDENCTV